MPYIGDPSGEIVTFPDKTSCLQLQLRVSSAAVQPRSAEAEREGLFAMGNSPQTTRPTTSACQECEHYRIARRDFDYIRSYALDDSCAFVAKHDWMRHRVALVTCNHICVAQAGGHDLDRSFVSARGFQS